MQTSKCDKMYNIVKEFWSQYFARNNGKIFYY